MKEFIGLIFACFLSSLLTSILKELKAEKQAKATEKAMNKVIEDGKPIKVYNGEKHIGDLIFVEHIEISVKTPPATDTEDSNKKEEGKYFVECVKCPEYRPDMFIDNHGFCRKKGKWISPSDKHYCYRSVMPYKEKRGGKSDL